MLGLTQIRYVAPVRRGAAQGLVARVYRQVERDFGVLAPPVVLHAPAPDPLAAAWLMLRETLVVPGLAPRAAKEAVATAVSLSNACPYCASIHNNALAGLVHVRRLAATDRTDPVTEAGLQSIADWVREGGKLATAGRSDLPFPVAQVPELAGVAVLLHYLNRVVNVFLRDVPLPPGVPELALGPVLKVLGRFMVAAARKPHEPGASLDLLPAAPLPQELSWAAGNSSVASAFARACTAIDTAGRRSVPVSVRELVLSELAGWQGELRGISRAWVEDTISALPVAERPAGRLALLVAFASYQVDKGVIDQFRHTGPDDRMLIELCSWAGMAAARRVGSWMPVEPRQPRV